MPFLQHLEELRKVLVVSATATGLGMIAGWLLAPRVLQDLIGRTVRTTIVLSPFEAFNERIKLAFILGLTLALPVVLWKLWSFVVPGLLRRERRWVVPLAAGSFTLFALGASAAYFYVVPLVIDVLQRFLVAGMVQQIRLGALLEFTYNLAFACGLLAQLPLVTMLLTALGLVTPGFLLRQWRIAIVGIFAVTAVVTPGDVVSAQILMGLPMMLLYFLSVGLSFVAARGRRGADASASASGARVEEEET
jgi:sec-independent protein translocase protein TatC